MLLFTIDLQSMGPLFFPLLSLICSIAFFGLWQQHILLFVLILAIQGIVGFFLIKSHRPAYLVPFILSITFALIGLTRINSLSQFYNSFPAQLTTKWSSIKGTVVQKNSGHNGRMRYSIIIQASRINDIPSSAHLVQIFSPKESNVKIGDTIEAKNLAIKAPKEGDFKKYLMKEGISATVFAEQFSPLILSRPTHSIGNWLHEKRQFLLLAFKKNLSPTATTLYASLFLGEKGSYKTILDRIQLQCKQWGILHYLARSGLHLVIVLSVYEKILRTIPLPFGLKQLILIILATIYFLLSWPSISFIRAFLVFLLYKLFMLTYTQTNFLHILTLSCIIILITNPFQLFFLDFQLSFCLTFALALINQYKTPPKLG